MSGPDALDYQVWGNAGVLYHKLQRKPKQLVSLKMHFSQFGLPYRTIDNSTRSAPLQLDAAASLALQYSYATDLKAPNQRASDMRHRIDATRQQINRRTCSCDAKTIHFALHSYTIHRSAASA